jgi:hypothetical protein
VGMRFEIEESACFEILHIGAHCAESDSSFFRNPAIVP